MTRRIVRPLAVGSLIMCLAGADVAYAVDLMSENFEGLPLQQVVTFETEVRSRAAWTTQVPTGGAGTWGN